MNVRKIKNSKDYSYLMSRIFACNESYRERRQYIYNLKCSFYLKYATFLHLSVMGNYYYPTDKNSSDMILN